MRLDDTTMVVTGAKPNRSPYVASKHGLEGLAECLALELEGTAVESLVFRPPRGGVYTESRSYRAPESYAHESTDVVAEPMVQLAGCAGEHGRRCVGTADRTGIEETDQSSTPEGRRRIRVRRRRG